MNKEHTFISKCMLYPCSHVEYAKNFFFSRALSISQCHGVSSLVTPRTTSPASSHFLIIPLIISIFYPLLQVVYLQVSCSSLKYSITRPEHQHGYLRPPSLNNLSFLLSLFRNAKCTRSETTVVLNTFFISYVFVVVVVVYG